MIIIIYKLEKKIRINITYILITNLETYFYTQL